MDQSTKIKNLLIEALEDSAVVDIYQENSNFNNKFICYINDQNIILIDFSVIDDRVDWFDCLVRKSFIILGADSQPSIRYNTVFNSQIPPDEGAPDWGWFAQYIRSLQYV